MAVFSDTFAQHAVFQGMPYLTRDQTAFSATDDNNGGHQSGAVFAAYFPNGTPMDYWGPGQKKWPVLFYIEMSGFLTSNPTFCQAGGSALAEAQGTRHQALLNGVAVINVQVPSPDWAYSFPAYNGGTAYVVGQYVASGGINYVCIQNGTGHTPASSPTFWTALAAITTGVTPGAGFLHAPGGTERRWESGAYASCVKGAILAYQYCQFFADYICSDATGTVSTLPTTKGLYGLDKRIFIPMGNSAGAHMASVLGHRPSFAGSLGGGYQYDESTVPAALVVGLVCVPWFESYQNAWVSADGQGNPYPLQDSASGDSTGANAVLPSTGLSASPVRYVRFLSNWPHYANSGKNCIAPTIYQSNTPAHSSQKYGEPFATDSISFTNLHSCTSGLVLKGRFGDRVTLYLGSTAIAGTPLIANALFDGQLDDYGEVTGGNYTGKISAHRRTGKSVPNGVFVKYITDAVRNVIEQGALPWDKTRAGVEDGIQRNSRVEITGRTVIPKDPGDGEVQRKSVTITNSGCLIFQQGTNPYVGALVNDLVVSTSQYGNPIAIVRPGQTVEVPSGQQSLWFKSSGPSGSYTDFVAVENY